MITTSFHKFIVMIFTTSVVSLQAADLSSNLH